MNAPPFSITPVAFRAEAPERKLAVTEYHRQRPLADNAEHGITPRSVSRGVEDRLVVREGTREQAAGVLREAGMDVDITKTIKELEGEMLAAAYNLEFEKAALLRDQINLKTAVEPRMKHRLNTESRG